MTSFVDTKPLGLDNAVLVDGWEVCTDTAASRG